jgi:pyruvate-formate lyase
MNERVKRLREESFDARPSFSAERAALTTDFYKEWLGRVSTPVLRAMNFRNLCEKKAIYIGEGELIVGERGPGPRPSPPSPSSPATPRRTSASSTRGRWRATRSAEDLAVYREKVIPYWRGRSMRDRAFAEIPEDWKELYEAGLFTEFMEQRAPGHTSLDGSIYRKGMNARRAEIAAARAALDWGKDPEALAKDEELKAMDIACEGAIIFARRHAELAEAMAASEGDP